MAAVIDPQALLELVAFADKNHDDTGNACNPQPGADMDNAARIADQT
jgi:hypothetical protein